MAMIAAVLVFASARVEAQCTTEELQALTCTSGGGYDIRVVQGPNGEFPVNNDPNYCDGAANCFTYSVTQNTSKNISQLDMLIPVCTSTTGIDNSITVQTGYPSGFHISYPGEGGQNTQWAEGVYQDYVLEYSFNTTDSFWLQTTKAGAAMTSMAWHIGNSMYSGKILGPACYQAKIATAVAKKIQLNPKDPNQYIIVTFGTDGNVLSVTDNNGNQLAWHPLSDLGEVNGLPVTYMPDGSIMKTGSSSDGDPCYNYFYGGRYGTVCY